MSRLFLSILCFTLSFQAFVLAQWQANVPVETRTLDEIYQAAQSENCDVLRVAGGGDGTRHSFIQSYLKANIDRSSQRILGQHDLKLREEISLD